jgi:hypothetical protein
MASRHSLTIQVAHPSFADRSLGGHLAAVNSGAPGNGDIFSFLAGLASWNPTPTVPPSQTADSRPPPYLDRRIVDQSQASIFDTGAPAMPFGPSDDPNFDPMQPWTVQRRR